MRKSQHYNMKLQEGPDDIDIGGISDNFEMLDGIAYSIQEDINSHKNNKSNPHSVTKSQIGLGNVTNIEQAAKTDFNAHTADKNNPHGVTKSQVGLGNVRHRLD